MASEARYWEYKEIMLDAQKMSTFDRSWIHANSMHMEAYLYSVIAEDAVKLYDANEDRRYQTLSSILNSYGSDEWELVQLLTGEETEGSSWGGIHPKTEQWDMAVDTKTVQVIMGALFRRPRRPAIKVTIENF